MGTSPQIEPTTTARLLTCMAFAIDETKLIRSIKKTRAISKQLEVDDPSSHRLLFLKREVSTLEARLRKIRRQAINTQTDAKLVKNKVT